MWLSQQVCANVALKSINNIVRSDIVILLSSTITFIITCVRISTAAVTLNDVLLLLPL